MKRFKNLSDKFVSHENAHSAFLNGIEHKKTHPEVRQLWKEGAEEKLPYTQNRLELLDQTKVNQLLDGIINDLVNDCYVHDAPRKKHQFCTSKSKGRLGKWRDLYCPSLRDHIMHHMLMQVSMPAFMRGMYKYCCGSVPGRGQSYAVKAVTHWCRDCHDWRYFVILDIRHNFDMIRIEKIQEALRRKIKDKKILTMHDIVLKSADRPAPVGYYPSPWYANLILEPIDHFIMEDLYKVRRGKRLNYVQHMIRYQDDILMLGNSKRDLEKAIHAIKDKLHRDLGLEIKDNWEIKRIAEYDTKGHLVHGTYRIKYIGFSFDRTRTIQMSRNYLSTKRLSHRIYKAKQAGNAVSLRTCQSLISKVGFASLCDNTRFVEEVNRNFPLDDAKGVISYASKCGVYSETTALGSGGRKQLDGDSIQHEHPSND